jgi:hypothetical protein
MDVMLGVKVVTCSLGWKENGGLRSVRAQLLSSRYQANAGDLGCTVGP